MVFFTKLGNFGRLGNQLFQIAATIGCAKENNTDAVFNYWDYSRYFIKKINQDIDNYIIRRVYREPSFNYRKIGYIDGLELLGYFQSERYFYGCIDSIREYFSFDTSYFNNYDHEFFKNKCSIHIRRGDYLNLSDHHPVLEISYYIKSINKIRSNSSDVEFCIFSDDAEWCKEHFTDDRFHIIEGNSDIEDLYYMSLCEHNIIANSSFSWWGAWLNSNKDKIVIAPRNWFGPAKKNVITSDIYCKDWIII